MKTYLTPRGWMTEVEPGQIFEATEDEIWIALRELGMMGYDLSEEFEEPQDDRQRVGEV